VRLARVSALAYIYVTASANKYKFSVVVVGAILTDSPAAITVAAPPPILIACPLALPVRN
jgi:hypothetical protein